MPATLPCDLCHQENAVYIVGDVRTGAQLTLGDNCIPVWAMGQVEGLIGLEGLAEMVAARIAAETPPPEEEPARGRRGKRPSPAIDVPAHAADPVTEEEAAEAAASDG